MKYFTLAILLTCTVAFAADEKKAGPPPPAIDVNQVGYVIGFPKQFVVRDFANKPTSFELRSDKKTVFKGKLTAVATPDKWTGTYLVGDFTEFDKPGKYTIAVASGTGETVSYPFPIATAKEVYMPSLKGALAWFKSKQCGVGKDKHHHDWDKKLPNPFGVPFDGSGGWHDAGDDNVYMGYLEQYNYMVNVCVPGATYMMLNAYERNSALYDAIDANTNKVADILDECAWGLDWLVRFNPPHHREKGGAWYKMKHDHYSNKTNQRLVRSNWSRKRYASIRGGAGMAIASLAKAARLNVEVGEFKPKDYRKIAQNAWHWYKGFNALECCDNDEENLLDQVGWALAGIEMYRDSKDKQFLKKAAEAVDLILNAQSKDDRFEGWFNRGDGGAFWSATDEGSLAHCMMEYARLQPDDTARVERIRKAVKAYMDYKITITKADNPYGLVRNYFKERHGKKWHLQFFMPHNEWSHGYRTMRWYQGENAKILSNAWLALQADEFLKTNDYRAFAMNQLNWVFGVNVQGFCFQKGFGSRNPKYFHDAKFSPGGIPNGFYGSGSSGHPSYGTDWRRGEECIYHLYMCISATAQLMKVAK